MSHAELTGQTPDDSILESALEGQGLAAEATWLAESEESESQITAAELADLESKPKTKAQIALDRFVCLLPTLFGLAAMGEYLYLPNAVSWKTTYTYPVLVGVLTAAVFVAFVASCVNRRVFSWLRYKAPFYSLVFVILLVYDVLTTKTGTLLRPFFPNVDEVLNAMVDDRTYLLDSTQHSLVLLFSGYFSGVIVGLLTGIACGYSKKVDYWIAPFRKLLGAIPSTTWIPVVMVIATSLFQGSVFIIGLGVWFAVTIATITGIRHIDKTYYEAARSLGAKGYQLVLRIAIPSAIPSIFQGMIQAMSSACTALMVAEMIGVQSGLGWYITWQKNFAEYDKMYAAIVVICLIFVAVNAAMRLIQRRLLRWQEGAIEQ